MKDYEKRNINFDILKLVSMFMIVILHTLGHGGVLNYEMNIMVGIQVWILESLSIVSVNCFVLVSGYFLFNGKFSWNKIFRIWLEVFIISVLLLVVSNIFGITSFSYGTTFMAMLPIISRQYWFVTVYIVMYIFSPYINIFLKNLNKKQFKCFVILIISVFSLFPTVVNFSSYMDMYGGGTGIVWFFCLYCVGAYFKMYGHDFFKKNKYLISFLLLSFITLIIGVLPFFTKSLQIHNLFVIASQYYMNYSTFVVFLQSLFLFLYFLNIKPRLPYLLRIIIINLSTISLGVYLLHDNVFIRNWLWKEINLPALISNENFALFEILKVVLIVFFSSLLLSYILDFCIQTIYRKLIAKKF